MRERRTGIDRRHTRPASTGTTLIIGGALTLAALTDLYACRTGRPTISRYLGGLALHPVAGPLVVGAYAGLVAGFGWHMAQIVHDETRTR